jgi:cell wall-associated NlpC family hydrolase
MVMLDRRLNAFRPDLADHKLRGKIKADCYAHAETARIAVSSAALRPRPDPTASIDTELLYGEIVDVFEWREGWAWVQARTDGYVGYLKAKNLRPGGGELTHLVASLRTYIYPEPDLKSPPLHLLSMNAPLGLTEKEDGGFGLLSEGGWVFLRHLTPLGIHETDHCAVAMQFIGTPYLWGGRTSLGLDCSALVQMSLMRCGIDVPRDSDMQELSIGQKAIHEHDLSDLRRGDVVYWNGHCGIWIEPSAFIHANATDMAVAIQPLKRILKHVTEATGDGKPRILRPQ